VSAPIDTSKPSRKGKSRSNDKATNGHAKTNGKALSNGKAAAKAASAVKPKPKKKKKPKSRFTAKTSDKHILYQKAVQDPEVEVKFITRVFKKLRERKPLTLREDFCGTALMCAEWVKSDKTRTAVGIDLEPSVLAWGVEHNLSPIDEPGNRIKLLQQDVCETVRGPFDVTVGFNFSYWIFKERAALKEYFKSTYKSLTKDGLLFLDAYGGYEAQEPIEEPRRVEGGFTYVWDQDKFNPIDHSVVNHIHFEFRDGTKMRKAFTYEWRFWTLPEIGDLLREVGYKNVTVYWEGTDSDGEGDGVFKPKLVTENEAAWVAYIVAEK
jgi:SAM-dependent methyltransferase